MADGAASLRRQTAGATAVLVLAPGGDDDDEACISLLAGSGETERNVLSVTVSETPGVW